MEDLNFNELVTMQSVLRNRLKDKEDWMDGMRGRDYDEHCKRHLEYHNDPNHLKLANVTVRINQFINKQTK